MDRGTEHPEKAVLLYVDDQEDPIPPFASLLSVVLSYWRVIGSCAAIAVVAAVTYTLFAPKWYRAQTVIAPVSQESTGSSLGNIGGELGGLASLVGVDLGNEEDSKVQALARLSSREFLYRFLSEEELMPILFAKRWNATENHWNDADPARHPTIEQGYRYFVDNVFTVSEDRLNGLVRVTVDWKEPQLASAWANEAVTRINVDRRSVARQESERTLEFLSRELTETNIVGLQQAINGLIESEIRKMMLVDVHEQYAFKVIDPAFVPGIDSVVRPRRAVLAATALIFGAVVGLAFAFLLAQRKAVKARTENDT